MKKEIELRAKVESLKSIENKLDELGFESTERNLVKDQVFDDKKESYRKKGSMIRLRTINNKRHLFAYKGPSKIEKYKIREESELEISNPEKLEEILKKIGLRVTFEMEKKRKTYYGDGCKIELDQYPVLGFFVEIEGRPEQIEKMISKLDVKRDKFNSRSLDFYINKKEKEIGEKVELKF